MKQTTLNSIPLTYVATFHGRETAGKDTETWLCTLVGHKKKSYIKLTNDALLTLTELAASQVGIALGMNIPTAYLVEITPGDLPVGIDFQVSDVTYCFASESCGRNPVSFERLGIDRDTIIDSWKEMDQTAVFDEWVANTDRHEGNLVYDPSTKTYWLIDHGRALGGMPPLLVDLTNPAMSVKNQLLDGMQNRLDNDYKNKLQAEANNLMLKCQTINLQRLDHDGHFDKLNTELSRHDVINFLTQRIHQTTQLICEKIGIPMLANPS